ncbi:putative selenate reductase [Thermanaeromonas toyohensis ToBE]|uniref:Putative selenate reductase n=1 Tax=Thermanaeromonas toyohensis ToBE TaxID=698762 RepID=A0A1W1W296_9FIRM|nr:putative selenate reductase subunit YgfK [Thermanaeromonas toyohensis]SMB99737.1 putative selenate reductase [Thermanaeromonas toyohensis ToBE]
MGDLMRPIPFRKLLNWVMEEYEKYRTIFGIPQEKFFRKRREGYLKLFGEYLGNPVGPAAGPHTQLAQNIVTSYLCGGRFFELKTVQVLDRLKLAKPCINAEDECYNVEWSTELSVEEALEEYIKAWFLLHILEKEIYGVNLRSFIFNMSVGYNLEGIKSCKVDSFIEGLKDASHTPIFQECKRVLKEEIKRFHAVDEEFIEGISPHICNSVTLSTMHGCPPGEIEAICKYLLGEKKLHTFVKLNPTLLGYEFVKEALYQMGYSYIQLKEESFAHDLQYREGIGLLKRVQDFANEQQRLFGVKLSNTLPVKITRGELPGEEMYMSGRALYPLTINLAYKLAAEFNGRLKVSYAGGVDAFNIARIFETGIWPITVATTLLKPGGYLRLKQMAEELEDHLEDGQKEIIDVEKLEELAASAFKDLNYHKEKRRVKGRKITKTLPLTDCFVAPCTVGCPIGQDVPEYIRLVGEKRYLEAYEVITQKNPLPFITGTLCPQFCAYKCTRLDYEEPVCIRELKKVAAEEGYQAYLSKLKKVEAKSPAKVAIIGAGPSGLAAGYFLAKAGLDVTIFDQKEKPGGTVQYVIPHFRISREAIENDLELIKRTGVKFELGIDPDFSVDKLKKNGYKYVYLALGATKSNPLELKTGREKVIGALEFLEQFNKNSEALELGKNVAVIGGGDSAMDAARAALRVKGVEKVYIIYRRTKEYMPANREELKAALAEGAVLKELLSPYSWVKGVLRCQKMELGEPDASGRLMAIPKEGEFEDIPVDTIISAIGQRVDYEILKKNGIEVNERGEVAVNPATNETNLENVFIGGDALRGPATIVQAIADGSKVARAILEKEGMAPVSSRVMPSFDQTRRLKEITQKKGFLKNSLQEKDHERCLECGFVCNLCVEVCPNRANIAIGVESENLKSLNQILHVDGMCNECGNCATFCPYDGAPYKDKLTLFWNEEDFANSQNNGFLLIEDGKEPVFKLRIEGNVFTVKFNAAGEAYADLEKGLVDLIWAAFKGYKYLFI